LGEHLPDSKVGGLALRWVFLTLASPIAGAFLNENFKAPKLEYYVPAAIAILNIIMALQARS